MTDARVFPVVGCGAGRLPALVGADEDRRTSLNRVRGRDILLLPPGRVNTGAGGGIVLRGAALILARSRAFRSYQSLISFVSSAIRASAMIVAVFDVLAMIPFERILLSMSDGSPSISRVLNV